jgi:putative glutamine amidotransferase
MAMAQPLIALTLDAESAGGYSKMPWYAIRQNYCDVIYAAGGIPIVLPHHVDAVNHYLDTVQGILITGGAFDIDPSLYGAATTHSTVQIKQGRTAFEWALTAGALERNIPVLGICGGQQLLNVVLGGTLIQHIPDEVANALAHEQPNPRTQAGHSVDILPNTLLARLVGKDTMHVNSAHHQAVKTVADGVIVNAYAPDGVIEGIEAPAHKFCLGVQWHPEYTVDEKDSALFTGLVRAASA